MTSITPNRLQQGHLEKFWEIFAIDGSKAVKVWDSKRPPAASRHTGSQAHRLYVKLSRLNRKEITRLATRISEIDSLSEQHLCLLR